MDVMRCVGILALALGALALQGDIVPVHDPSSIFTAPWLSRNATEHYFVACTGVGAPLRASPDGMSWRRVGQLFDAPLAWWKEQVPNWGGDVWAPDVLEESEGSRLAFYSISSLGSQDSCIGAARSNATTAPAWVDLGPVVCSEDGPAFNAIDPHAFWDADRRLWLVFGSWFAGIWVVELDPQAPQKTIAAPVRVAGRDTGMHGAIEASWIEGMGDAYYLFVNWDKCCDGVHSTYNIRVGRSKSPSGPFLDKDGVDMADGGGSLFAPVREDNRIGPGHVGIATIGGRLVLSTHFYNADKEGEATLDIQDLKLADGWPVRGTHW